jgi:hypothetical protein
MHLALFACLAAFCYPILTKLITLPARSTLVRRFRNKRTDINITFRNSEEIPRIIQRDRSMIGHLTEISTRLPVVVAVDAMSLNPALAIQRGEGMNRVLGAVDTIEVSDQQIIEYSTSSREFKKWAKNNSQSIITNTFAFLMQPLDPRLLYTLLHLLPATSRKASDETIRTLLRIREFLRDCGVDVSFLTIDGDPAYSEIV